jgi:methylmalonyl-CoA carboxyltransferase large subunit
MTNTQNADDRATLVKTLTTLRMEVAALADRLTKLEAAGLARSAEGRAAVAPAEAQLLSPVGVTPDIIAVITAALAAYLGVKPHIRQITMLSGAAWAQQGRVTIQASHSLTLPRD